ncbi:MAG TPA: DUF885 family protein [Steroidobacteraceae bacterium]|nr:DUF885 family protein [Steroidobacteraceae bacterium]
MRKPWLSLLSCALVLALPQSVVRAADSVHEQLVALARDITFTTAAAYPMQATSLGIPGHDGELDVPGEAARAAHLARLQQWQQRLRDITATFTDATALADRDDALLVGAELARGLNVLQVYQADRKDFGGGSDGAGGVSAGANGVLNAVFRQFEHLPIVGQEGATAADQARAWADITSRLEKAPAYIAEFNKGVTHPGHLLGLIRAAELGGAPEFFNGALTDAARAQLGARSRAFARFTKARDGALAAMAATKAYIDAHVASWPENFAIGREAFDHMLRDEQLLPFNSSDIERMGRDELAHGWAEEAWLVSRAHHEGVKFGPETGGGLAPGGAALIDYYRDRIAELTTFMIEHEVVTIPDWLGTVSVTETPHFLLPVLPGANMNPPRKFSASNASTYYIAPVASLADAAARLDMNQDFDHDRIMSTGAHEVMPGHYLQESIAKRHPNFIRKIQDSAVFVEGWAFYGEEMLVRLGLYGERLDGRLFTARWERVRGARAIVDARLASGEWSYEQAVDFYTAQGGFTREAAAAQVADIAASPGYYFAYTAGRAQIEELCAAYILKQGDKGSLRDFHDRLLSYGATPLAIIGPELLADLDKPAAAVRAAANY